MYGMLDVNDIIETGYISRSVAGSYDNEGVAIFALIFAFYLWVKAVKTVLRTTPYNPLVIMNE